MIATPGARARLERWGLYGGALALTIAGFLIAYQFVEPAPPRQFRIATGPPDGAYHPFGEHYREILRREGIAVEVIATAGSAENLALLADRRADVGFVQGGIVGDRPPEGLVSLASLYFEPLWLFHRRGLALNGLDDLRGKRVAIGPEGSGTRVVALQLLDAVGIAPGEITQVDRGGMQAASLLKSGEVDIVFVIAGADSRTVDALFSDPNAELFNLERAEAFAKRFRFLSVVTLPEGAFDLARNLPPRPVTLVAPTATLVATESFHPALIGLLLQAATRIHEQGGLFGEPGQFPSPQWVEVPLAEDARHFFKSGPPLLQRFLPFWAASLIDRLLIMLLPLLTLLIPLSRVVPPLYRWRVRSRIYRWYGELSAIDLRNPQQAGPAQVRDWLADLERIEGEVRHISVPLSYADALYHLRLHIELVRERLLRPRGAERPVSPAD